ncbi:MAG: cytochrome bc complex cytochrome b subunit [Ignavibacteriae bacterium]|nr:cytochrome bc complex cytochrome b subunit [Ignavibacteriota bacterium]NOG96430.1 cytochrome bc complex cytochrome b subunit [Ignavibacteriota bacterium]
MKKNIKEWFLKRVPVDVENTSKVMSEIMLKEPIPSHMKHWYYALGAAPLILFIIQVVTGILLTFYYIPSTEMAFESVRYITEEVRMGFYIRGLHRWGSNLMVITIFLHMLRVFFTRGYRKPRELNWVLGVVILFVTLTLCFTGYSMVYNQLSYWAATVGTNMIKEIPLIGLPMLELLRGGTEVTGNTLTRFFNLHIGFLPTILLVLLALHIIMVRVHGVSKLEGREDDEKTYPFYPEHFYHTLIIGLFILSVLSALTVILPPGLGEAANPSVTPNHIKPEWYFYGIYSLLKFIPIKLGIYLITIFVLIGTFFPFIDDYLRTKLPKVKVHYIFGILSAVLFLFFTVFEMFSN